MKVICIDNKIIKGAGNKYIYLLIEGCIYTVASSKYDCDNDYSYKLKELPAYILWNARRFIPLSEIDEMELVNEKTLTV